MGGGGDFTGGNFRVGGGGNFTGRGNFPGTFFLGAFFLERYFSRDSLCFIHFDVIIRQRLKKISTFFRSRKRNKNMWSCATTDTRHAQ